MKVMILANETPDDFASRENKAAYEPYMARSAATVVSVRDGVRKVEDGPFPDTKEQLGGFFVIDAPDIDDAAQWAMKCPAANKGFVDVRVIPDYAESE